ncbi:hypothetical protein GUJ93_ZPchr0009g579 [Zizania palustris]|uniref:Uncharacterized protein n=1 Tax=Zizania palustris TaxID=103762 RepID=A0A8J5R493_ZIZPA|nr:hypothetical protein GUJ93_ZPchr0009g579 [Zizania palustris]
MQWPPMEGDPCPNCILNVVGMAFGVGDVGGSAFYFINGLHNSPKGALLAGGMETARLNVPLHTLLVALLFGARKAVRKGRMAAASNKDKDGSNNGEDEKTGYMHMRARTGQAMDSHNLADRVIMEMWEYFCIL